MKKMLLFAGLVFIITNAFMIRGASSGIHGTISPADAAKKVWVVSNSGKDTISVQPSSGKFSLDVKPGSWKIFVEAVKPYKDAVVNNITVDEGKYTDAGEIKLSSD